MFIGWRFALHEWNGILCIGQRKLRSNILLNGVSAVGDSRAEIRFSVFSASQVNATILASFLSRQRLVVGLLLFYTVLSLPHSSSERYPSRQREYSLSLFGKLPRVICVFAFPSNSHNLPPPLCPYTSSRKMLCPTCKTSLPGIEDQSQTIEILESQVRQLSQKLAFAGTSHPSSPSKTNAH